MPPTTALAWAVGLGSPYTFETTLESEYKSDIFGERGILLGAVHGIAESLYSRFVDKGEAKDEAFINSAESITGPISTTISRSGLRAVYDELEENEKAVFRRAYNAAYHPCREILEEIYDDVASGNEVRSVIQATRRHGRYPMGKIDSTDMWQVGEKVRADSTRNYAPLHAETAGVYLACMMAQVDHSLRPRTSLLGDRERIDHRSGRQSESLHGLQGCFVHGRQLLDHGAARGQEVGVALRLHPDPACLHRHRRESGRRRDAVRGVPEVGHSRGPRDLRRTPPVGGHRGCAASRVAETIRGKVSAMVGGRTWAILRRNVDVAMSRLSAANARPNRSMCRLLVLGEDHRISLHPGVDPLALCRAAWRTSVRGRREGGSTIAMQLVRVLTGRYERSWRRKAREMVLAVRVTRHVSSGEFPALYLSVAYYGWRMNGFFQACRRLQIDPGTCSLHHGFGGVSYTVGLAPFGPLAQCHDSLVPPRRCSRYPPPRSKWHGSRTLPSRIGRASIVPFARVAIHRTVAMR